MKPEEKPKRVELTIEQLAERWCLDSLDETHAVLDALRKYVVGTESIDTTCLYGHFLGGLRWDQGNPTADELDHAEAKAAFYGDTLASILKRVRADARKKS